MERRTYSRSAGIVLLITVLSVLVVNLSPGLIAGGNRVTGTSDVAAVTAFYSHSSTLPFLWQSGIAIVGVILFAVLFRRYLQTFQLTPSIAAAADFGTAIAVAAAPLYAISAALQSAMVQLVAAGEVGRPALLGVFASWDWIYNSFAYFFEAGYMAAWAVVAWKSGALPRWIAVIGAAAAVGHVFNSQVLLSHMSDSLTLLPTAIFLLWFISAGIFLIRGGKGATTPVAN